MGLSKIIRGAGRSFMSVGRAVQSASKKLDQAVTGQPMQPMQASQQMVAPPTEAPTSPEGATAPAAAPAAQTASAPQAQETPRGFPIPDIGPGPDINAPEFQGPEGAKKYETASRDYQHKLDIHETFAALDKHFTSLDPKRDYQKEYEQYLAEQKQHEQERPKGNNLARAALALGDFNPAVQQSGRSNLDTYNQNVDKAAADSDKSFSQRMTLRQKMHEQAAADAETKGNWKKALAEQEKLALMRADDLALGHTRDMEKTKAVQDSAAERAQIRADAMTESARIRASAIGATHDLTGNFLKEFEKETAKAVAKFLGPQNTNKTYSTADLDSLTLYIEHIAELFHDKQFGTDDSGTGRLNTPPGKRKPAPPDTKEEF